MTSGSILPNYVGRFGRWSRRDLLKLGGGLALFPLAGCTVGVGGAAGGTAVRAAAPWAGQFLKGLAFELLSQEVAGYIRGLGSNEAAGSRDALELMDQGDFTQDCLDAYRDGLVDGAANVYQTSGLRGVCRVDPAAPHETCIGFWGTGGVRPFALEGPVLGALYGVAGFLRNEENMPDAEIANAIVPKWSHRMGAGLRFETEEADRLYRTGIGDMAVSWVRQGEAFGSAVVELPSLGTVDVREIPFLFSAT